MILLIPNIDIQNGKCKEIINGEIGTETYYNFLSCNPEELIKLIRRENAKSVNIVDLDSYENLIFNNNYFDLVENTNGLKIDNQNLLTIQNLCRNTDIPIQLEINIKSSKEIVKIFELGVFRISIKVKSDLSNIELIKFLLDDFGTNKISIIYELETISFKNSYLINLLNEFEDFKNLRLILDFKNLKFINANDVENLFISILDKFSFIKSKNLKFTLKNYIKNSQDLFSINLFEIYNVDSLIVGSELNKNIFPCQKIWREIESKIEILS